MGKKILIIGAGASGLTAIKCCLDENLEPVCYEKSHDIGGLWRYEENERSEACVYKSTIINTSKEMMCFSDYPIPKEFPNYMHNTKIIEYFRMYCNEFQLHKYIQFHTEILSCKFAEDYDETGQWVVNSQNIKTKEQKFEKFDGVIVAVGHHAKPNYPLSSFKGIDVFKGEYLHSHSYRKPNNYENKKVLVVGIGNSGGDISVELSRVSKQVFLSTRRGSWVMHRVSEDGMPSDFSLTTRLNNAIYQILPPNLRNNIAESRVKFDHEKYGLTPKHRFFSQHVTVNDDMPNRILSGTLKVKGDIKYFKENGVVFEDGEYQDIDAVVFATGYNFCHPFLDQSVVQTENNKSKLYKYIWPIGLKKPTLALIGGIQPLGAINPISEVQSRWITRVFKGLAKLPSEQEMVKEIDEKTVVLKNRYYDSPRHTIQVDYIPYMDEIAEEIGVKPNFWKLLGSDPMLALKVLTSGCTPYQYRLVGPGKWAKARETIMTQKSRVLFPLNTRPTVFKSQPKNYNIIVFMVVLAMLIWYLL